MSGATLDWAKLLSDQRRPKTSADDGPSQLAWFVQSRTETERDFDRILFATPTRRLGDKTQVFPLEKNESVRTRLTHSHEVSNLARSIGIHLIHDEIGQRIVDSACATLGMDAAPRIRRAIPAMMAAIGLAHDLGNPPFGHQGEEAIRAWIRNHEDELWQPSDQNENAINDDIAKLKHDHKEDFRNFEGNAQTLRTITRLQVVKDNRGLNLTFGTLAALMKYTVGSGSVERVNPPAAKKKVGFFVSENGIVDEIHAATGLSKGLRHPFTYLMEACDDIAYSVIDAEDAVKKQIVSFWDLIAWLENGNAPANDELVDWLCKKARHESGIARKGKLSPSELNDVSIQIFRAFAISGMISAVLVAFKENFEIIARGSFEKTLIEVSKANTLCKLLKSFDLRHAYKHRRVLEIELEGNNTLHGLMDMFWRGIRDRAEYSDPGSERKTPFTRYAYSRISENYRRVFEAPDASLPIRYKELQLLTDMVAGMTDQFAMDLHQELLRFDRNGNVRL